MTRHLTLPRLTVESEHSREGDPTEGDPLTAVPGPFGGYGLDHQPISALGAAMLLGSEERIIEATTIGDVTISTAFLIFDHSHRPDDGLVLYETMVVRGGWDATWCERYRTRDAALAGHDRACAWVRSPEQAPAPLVDVLLDRP